MGRLSHHRENLGLHRCYGAARASRDSATKTVSVDIGNSQQHQRRAALGARQGVPPIRTDRQGRSPLCRRDRGRERARTDQSAQRRLCGVRARGLGYGWRGLARARRGRRCKLCCAFHHSSSRLAWRIVLIRGVWYFCVFVC